MPNCRVPFRAAVRGGASGGAAAAGGQTQHHGQSHQQGKNLLSHMDVPPLIVGNRRLLPLIHPYHTELFQ
jgi:hypothetical protein